MLEGGRPCTDCGVLVEGTALYFGGADARQAVTADLDLRGAKLVLLSTTARSFLLIFKYFATLSALIDLRFCG